jgi:hypothetical protein
MSYVGPITQNIIDLCISEFKKNETREKVTKNVINPIVREISTKLLPYFATLLVLQIIIVVLVIYTMLL